MGTGSWRSVWIEDNTSGMPRADAAHDLLAVGAEKSVSGFDLRGWSFQVRVVGWVPGLHLGRGEQWGLAEQSAHTIEAHFGGGVQPSEGAHAGEVARQGVLQEATHELEGLDVDGCVLARLTVAIAPEQAAIGQHGNVAIGSRGLEDVAGEITQGVLAGTGRSAVHVPMAFPHLGWNLQEEIRVFLEQPLLEECAEVSPQSFDRQEELVARGHPGATIGTQAAAGNQIVDVRMEDEGATPGMQYAQHPQLRAQSARIASQVLQGAGTGGKEQVEADPGMGANETPQGLGHREGDQEAGSGQEESGALALEPVVGIGLTALGTVPVVTGVIAVVKALTVGTLEELAAQGRGATTADLVQDLSMSLRHGVAEGLEIGRCQMLDPLSDGSDFTTVAGGGVHQRSPMKSSRRF